MKKSLTILFFSSAIAINAQSDFKNFLKLSIPIKKWVLLHPFKAKLSLKIANETNKVSDSMKNSSLLDKDGAGGQVDAFRHAYWMARLQQQVGKRAARSLGKAYEKDNYITYKKLKLEAGIVPDEIATKMDLYNNEEGLKLIKKGSVVSRKGLVYRVINAIYEGRMKIIKKDSEGNFLTCEGKIISAEKLKGKWKNNKCLVSSKKLL
jgi:butyrate kinase